VFFISQEDKLGMQTWDCRTRKSIVFCLGNELWVGTDRSRPRCGTKNRKALKHVQPRWFPAQQRPAAHRAEITEVIRTLVSDSETGIKTL
jgi:hypothetical protein